MVTSRFTDHDGVRIHYLDNDPAVPVGAPVVFVPGLVDAADEYTEMLERFGDRRLLVIDVRGHGASDAPPRGYSVEDQAGDVEAVLRASGIDRFHMTTFSRGTTAALLVVFGRPERILSVAIGDYLPVEVGLKPDFVERISETSWRGTSNAARVPRHAFEGTVADAQAREFWDELGALTVPVLAARGLHESSFIDDEQVARYRQSCPGIEIVDFPDSGHDLFRPSRTAYPDAVLDFIARRVPGH